MTDLTDEQVRRLRSKCNLPDPPPRYAPMAPGMVNRAYRAAIRKARVDTAITMTIMIAIFLGLYLLGVPWKILQLIQGGLLLIGVSLLFATLWHGRRHDP